MLRRILFLMVFLIGTVTLVSGQTNTKMDSRALLVELGSMLKEIPESTVQCQALLQQIKAWQEKKLKELEAPKAMLRITAPSDDAEVSERPFVEGTVADPKAKVWVIIHPMEVSDYWVQPSVAVKENGTWKVVIYIGRPGRIDVGKKFEIMAVANPNVKLSEGDILSGWPEAEARSDVIEVTRK
jgi:hypothetical protein